MIQVHTPIYVMLAPASCWKCGATTTVAGLASIAVVDEEGETFGDLSGQGGDVIGLQNITDMPYDVLEAVRAFQPSYVKHESRTAGHAYYQNVCTCGANFGDFHLWKPEGPFFPTTVEQASAVRVQRVPVVGTQEFDADFSQGGLDLIFGNLHRNQPRA